MSRFKNSGFQKLYRPETGINEEHSHLHPILSRPINGDSYSTIASVMPLKGIEIIQAI